MGQRRKILGSLVAAALAFAAPGCNGASHSAPAPVAPSTEPPAGSLDPVPVPIAPARPAPASTPRPVGRSEAPAIENAAYAEAAAYSARHGGLALVVIEGDRVALALGQNGHPVDEAHPLHGASESFWGPAAVAAERDGWLDLDERVADTIGEWAGLRGKRDVRVRQLLEYTSGLESGVWPLLRERPTNHYARALALEMIAAPGERFQVGPSHLAVFGELLRRKLAAAGLDALGYLDQRILRPIGLEIAGWQRDATGNPELANGARMTAREWAKFGVLIRDRGDWDGQRVIDAEAIEACLSPGEIEPRFGLTIWLGGREPDPTRASDASGPEAAARGRAPADLAMAAGAGNQRLYVIPSLELVVARFGRDDREWRDPDFIALITAAAASPN